MSLPGPGKDHTAGDITSRIAALSPEKRALLEARLERRHTLAPGPDAGAPLSFAQERIYKLARANPDSGFFVLITRIQPPPHVDLPRLRTAITSVIERHESLRTEVVERDGRATQVVRPASEDVLVIDDASGRHLDRRTEEAARAVRTLSPPHWRMIVRTIAGAPVELVFVAHAVVCDGPSLAILQQELLSACATLAEGRALDLPPVHVRPSDLARDQRRRLQGPHLERLVERFRFLELAPNLSLHTDRARPVKGLPEIVSCGWQLGDTRVRQVADAAGVRGVSSAALWTAAVSAVLSRFSRQSQVVIGVQVSNRATADMRRFVGVASGVVPVGMDLSNDPAYGELAARADAQLREAIAAGELPHETLAQELRVQRSGRQHALFQVVLAVRSDLEGATPEPALESGWFSGGSVHFDLAIVVDDLAVAGQASLLYDSRLFEEETVRAIAQSLDVLIEAAPDRPDEPVTNLPILHPAEKQVRWTVPLPEFASTIHGVFEKRAALDPDRLALVGDATLTYADLNSRANRLAHALLAHGVEPGETVGVAMRRSVELVVACLAILKTGAVYLPLDPMYPAERLTFMLQDSGATLLLTQGDVPEQVHSTCEVIDLRSFDVARDPAGNLDRRIDGAEPAYLMYTSGSTGRPKGVVVQHLGVCHAADAQMAHFGLTGDDQVLQFASPSFDASIFEMVMAPRCGGVLHLAPAEELMPGPPLVHLLKVRRITVLTMPPSALAAVPPVELPDLRIVISAGERCPAELVVRWASGRRFFNAYGPTEASIWATVAECAPAERAPSIGAPLSYVWTRVVDDRLRAMPIGAPGELLLGGPCVALGYWNRPELTAERFLADTTADHADRWYRTGDVVCRDSRGSLWHVGRIDRQVKVRGFRIEPGEIEACLTELPGVDSAAVEVEHDTLVAYYTGASAPDVPTLQRALARRLPLHMVPGSFSYLEAMPLNSNGKLDRAMLSRQSRPRTADGQAPRTPTEAALSEIWKSVLRIEKVGMEDNFFDLGGHSLLAASVMSRAAAALGRELPLHVIFRSRTIAQLAQAFDSAEVTA